jgi:dihydrofolate reductase
MSLNRCIGQNNELPWHVPEDLQHFKDLTLGKPVLLGRKTYASILARLGKPLPGRTHHVLTRQEHWGPLPEHREQVRVVRSVEESLWLTETSGEPELMVIGGAEVYAASLSMTDRIEITWIDLSINGDAYFPALADEEWTGRDRSDWHTSRTGLRYSFQTLERPSA